MRLSKSAVIAEILENDGVVVLPTDTVYGLFCKASSRRAVDSIYKIKGRSNKKPLQLFLPDKKLISKYTVISALSKKKINAFLPGPYTLILKLKPEYKKTFSFLKTGTAGVRVIKSRLINDVMKRLKAPIAATSANISGEASPTKYDEIDEKVLSQVSMAVKDDKKVKGKSSRVIDITGSIEIIIRS
jgi:L-threonylcarbamoyladenylate synthase